MEIDGAWGYMRYLRAFIYLYSFLGVVFLILGSINPLLYMFSLFAFALTVGFYYAYRKSTLQDAQRGYPRNSHPIDESSSCELSNPLPPQPEIIEPSLKSESSPEIEEPLFESENSPPDFEHMSKIETANWMREHPTPAEKRMLEILNSSIAPNFPEHPFNFQDLKYGYIFDFHCPTLGLDIEVDGGIHNNRRIKDSERDFYLAERGVNVFRVSNNEVFDNSKGVAETLCKIIKDKDEQLESEKRNFARQREKAERYRRRY